MYIHNISNSTKTYGGQPIASGDFYSIPESRLSSYAESDVVISAIMIGDAAISLDGINDLSEKIIMVKTLFGNAVTTSSVLSEGGLKRSDRGLHFTAAYGVTTTADYSITEDLQIKGGVIYTEDSHIFDSVSMEIITTEGDSLHHYLKDFPVSKDGISKIKNGSITNAPLNGLIMRVTYKSNGLSDVKCNVGVVAYT